MSIKVGDIIKVQYEGSLEDGTVFDSTELNGEPLIFEVGAGNIIQGFENSVIGKAVGKEFDIKIQPSEAYGDRNPQFIKNVPKSEFPENIDPKPGMILQISGPHGEMKLALIAQVEENEIKIDMNHPMSGLVLNFKIKILEVGCELPKHTHGESCGCGHDHH